MNAEQLVPSLETCRQLKEAGFPQDTVLAHWWRERVEYTPDREKVRTEWVSLMNSMMVGSMGILCAAPTLAEVLTELPGGSTRTGIEQRSYTGEPVVWEVQVDNPWDEWTHYTADRSMVEAAAQLWLALYAAGHIKQDDK